MKSIIYCSLMLAFLSFSLPSFAGGLLQVRQTIFGMDCAPCAYGVEKGLKALHGVKTVKVSLNEGYTAVTFSSDSRTSLLEVRNVIRRNGFTPKEAQIELKGEIQLSPQPSLVANGTRYALLFDAVAMPHASAAGQLATVTGTVMQDAGDVQVTGIVLLDQ
ncbi:MAG: heavy-metal-associated domain-containing protein [Gammaproteobacteria bacterium]